MYIDSFQKWRDLPENVNYLPASKFERSLLHISMRLVKRLSFNPLIDVSLDG